MNEEENIETTNMMEIGGKKYFFDFKPLTKLKQAQQRKLCCLFLFVNFMLVIVLILAILYNNTHDELIELTKKYEKVIKSLESCKQLNKLSTC